MQKTAKYVKEDPHMAVYQISRIQIRRGQKTTGTGIPQLASGELAWAIDSQELFIGNGAVAEGAPAVGNTKIITENDNFIDVIGRYQYAANNNSIQTNDNPLIPVIQNLQDVLDRTVFAENFDVRTGAGFDNSSAIQRALDQLYLKPGVYNEAEPSMPSFSAELRVELKFTPGWYDFSTTIYIPSFAYIAGAGTDKTIFNYTGTGNAFEFVNDSSTIGNPSVIASTTYINQPKNAHLRDFTLITNATDVTGLELTAVRDSIFENIEIIGNWTPVVGDQINGYGLNLTALSTLVTTQRNKFKNVTVDSMTGAVFSRHDIFNNSFEECHVTNSQYGIVFGVGTDQNTSGEEFGPRKNRFTNCVFENINKNGILIETGYGNKSRGNTFLDVGNDGGVNTNGKVSPISFISAGNSSVHDTFDRRDNSSDTVDLTYDYKIVDITGNIGDSFVTVPDVNATIGIQMGQTVSITGVASGAKVLSIVGTVVNLTLPNTGAVAGSAYFMFDYVPEVEGALFYQNVESQEIQLNRTPGANPENASHRAFGFRIPLTSATGYCIDYKFKSEQYVQMRKGQLNIAVDRVNGTVQLVDEFEYTGTLGEDERIAFAASIVNNSLVVYYTNVNPIQDNAMFTYTYTMLV